MFFTDKIKKELIKNLKEWVLNEIVNSRIKLEEMIESKISENSENEKQANLLAISEDINDYALHGYSDKKVRKKHADKIKSIYNRECAICGCKDDKELTLDHYYIPRSKGGMFIMRDRNINAIYSNCVLLCQECNVKKAAMSVNDYITDKKKRLKIAKINSQLTEYFRSKLGAK